VVDDKIKDLIPALKVLGESIIQDVANKYELGDLSLSTDINEVVFGMGLVVSLLVLCDVVSNLPSDLL